jgi:predicted nucleotidyltransferase
MQVVRVTKTFYETEDGEKTYFAEPLEKKLSIEEMQEIVNHCEDMVSRIRRKEGSEPDDTDQV